MHKQIHSFQPFDLKSNPGFLHDLQELVFYGGSRATAAACEMSKASVQVAWKQECLQREVFVIMSYVGIASTLGYVIEIPHIIRSLADSLLPMSPDDLPLEFDSTFIRNLTYNGERQDGQVVESYHNPWWTWTSKPTLEQIMSNESIASYIEHHRRFSEPPEVYPIIAFPQHQFSNTAHPSCDQCLINQALAHRSILQIKAIEESVITVIQEFKGAWLTGKRRLENVQESGILDTASLESDDLAASVETRQPPIGSFKQYKHANIQYPEVRDIEHNSLDREDEISEGTNDQRHKKAPARELVDNSEEGNTEVQVYGHSNDGSLSPETGGVADSNMSAPPESTPEESAFDAHTSMHIQDSDFTIEQSFSFQRGENLSEQLQGIQQTEMLDTVASASASNECQSSTTNLHPEKSFTDGYDLHEIFKRFLSSLEQHK